MFLVITLVFLNRYVFGLFLKQLRRGAFDAARPGWEPTVTVVTPVYNEGRRVARTIDSVMALDYPREKLSMIVVDDCSTDDSYAAALRAARRHAGVTVLRNAQNRGKRRSIVEAVRRTSAEIVVSIDSDVEVAPDALRHLVARFSRPEIAAVGGRVCVSNANANWLTRLQAIKYYFGYEYLKNLERSLQTVMCLSGCLTAYRRAVLVELEPVLLDRRLLGVPIRYGEDRFLTRQIVKRGYRTTLSLDAVCFTVAPARLSTYFSQQLRWRRSNFVDVLCGAGHAWRLHPIVCVHYLSLGAMLVAYPLVVLEQLAAGTFFEFAWFNMSVLSCISLVYWIDSRRLPASARVSPVWFLSAALVMPVTYVLFTPLALFTLDSSSWETRAHRAPAGAPASEPLALPGPAALALPAADRAV